MILYHNPRCSKSRQTLALLEEHGHSPEIVKYLETPLDVKDLKALAKKLNRTPREMMRVKEAIYKEEGLKDADDEALFAAMAAYPILMERPILVNGAKAAIGRPPEAVLEIL
ncbi:MAG: arsenate reductase (glutaredoxin) [Pseudomonadota bacterium]